jgi:MFS family permease
VFQLGDTMQLQVFKKGSEPSFFSYRTLLIICCLVTCGCYVGAYMRIPVLPLFARSMGADTLQIGIITSSFMMAAGLLSIPLGILSDRLGRKRLILTGLLISAASSFLIGLCNTFWQMAEVYIFAGAGLAAFAPTMMSFVSDFSPKTHLGRSYGWYTMALYGGMSIGPSLGGLAAQVLDFRRVFALSGIITFVMFCMVLLFLPDSEAPQPHQTANRSSRLIVGELLRNRPLWACWLVTFVSCFGLGMFITFVPLHASDRGITIGQIGLIFGTQALVNAFSRIPFGYLSDRVSDRSNLVLVGLLGYSAAIAGIGISTSLGLFLLSAFLMGISMGVAFTAVGALIAEVVPIDSKGLAMGGYNTCIYLGMMLSALIMGMVARRTGFCASFLIAAFVNVIGACGFGIISKTVSIKKEMLSGN